MSTSTSPAACASVSPPPILPPRRPSSPRSRARRSRPTRSISARSGFPARSGRSPRRRPGSRRRQSSASPTPSRRTPAATRASARFLGRPRSGTSPISSPASPPPPVHGRCRCSGAGKGDAASFAVYTRGQPARPGHPRFRQALRPLTTMPVSVLDLVVLGVVLISALLAAVRGFTREVLAIVAWVTAAAVAWFLHPLILPRIKDHISNPTLALAAAIGAIFVVTLLIVSIITVKFSDFVLDSRIGALDRTLGFVFGAARGLLICVVGWVFLAWLVQGKMPEWASNARSRPMLENTGNSLIAMLPDPEGVMARLRKRQNDD